MKFIVDDPCIRTIFCISGQSHSLKLMRKHQGNYYFVKITEEHVLGEYTKNIKQNVIEYELFDDFEDVNKNMK